MRIKILKICFRKKRKKRWKFVLIPTELGEAFGTEETKSFETKKEKQIKSYRKKKDPESPP